MNETDTLTIFLFSKLLQEFLLSRSVRKSWNVLPLPWFSTQTLIHSKNL